MPKYLPNSSDKIKPSYAHKLGMDSLFPTNYRYTSADMPVYAGQTHTRQGQVMGYKVGRAKHIESSGTLYDTLAVAEAVCELLNAMALTEVILPKKK